MIIIILFRERCAKQWISLMKQCKSSQPICWSIPDLITGPISNGLPTNCPLPASINRSKNNYLLFRSHEVSFPCGHWLALLMNRDITLSLKFSPLPLSFFVPLPYPTSVATSWLCTAPVLAWCGFLLHCSTMAAWDSNLKTRKGHTHSASQAERNL